MTRRAVTLIELMVVLSIIGILCALLLPAVQAAREKARETVCKNNLYQLNMAVASFMGIYKKLPAPNPSDKIGGWCIEILPFMEQKNLHDKIRTGTLVAEAPDFLYKSPRLFRCPTRSSYDSFSDDAINPGHYVLVPLIKRESYMLFDAPLQSVVPWATSPEISYAAASTAKGPHHGGVFFTNGFQQGVDLMVNGQTSGN